MNKRVSPQELSNEDLELISKRKEMSKQAWIKNVMRIYPEKTLQETEDLHNILFEEPEMPNRPPRGDKRNQR